MGILSEYLTNLNEESEIQLNEGIGDIANKIFLFLGYGMPKDPEIKALSKSHGVCLGVCRRAFPEERTTTRKRGSDTISVPYDPYNWDERRARKDQEETSETVKENPEYGKCALKCRLEYLKQILKVLKKKGKKVCVGNRNVGLCEKWVDKYLPEFEGELKSIELILKNTNTKNRNMAIKNLLKIV